MLQVGELDGVVDVLSWWTFSDVFEEAGIPTAGREDMG
jgi:beta-xylosidase